MRDFLKAGLRRLGAGGIWALALLSLPNCALERGGIAGPTNLNRGSSPESSAVFCDIERPGPRTCATDEEVAMGLRLSETAVALVAGRTAPWGIDDSPAARLSCGGSPQKVMFDGPFPEGSAVCINCSVIPFPHADATAVCVAQCLDTDAGTFGSCSTRAHVSTNAQSPTFCFGGACSSDGMFLGSGFSDPRRISEPVVWTNVINAGTFDADNNTLRRTAPFSGAFDAGATSSQTIDHGDGYVQFTAAEQDTVRLCGLSVGAPPDTNTNYTTIDFAINVFSDGYVYIFELGTQVIGPDNSGTTPGSFGPYLAGQTFRVRVKDNQDGTAQVTYTKLTGSCSDGSPCPETILHTSVVAAHYPLRVDSSLFNANATLTNVRLVRIR